MQYQNIFVNLACIEYFIGNTKYSDTNNSFILLTEVFIVIKEGTFYSIQRFDAVRNS